MTMLGQLAAFALGVWVSIRMIAALYQILDLWYRIGTDYPRVIRGVVGRALTIAAIAWLLDAAGRVAFASGLVAFLLFYLSLYGLRHLLILALRVRTDDASPGANRNPIG
ncbi:MAG TPA: hypothetical protein PLD86_06945 [Vicinamibacteria bacterium]|nr:hypothetical protein [Vicinamibacteria bacterium]